MSADDSLARHCEWAAKIVATWPAWKQNALRWYGTPTHLPDQRREPVENTKEKGIAMSMKTKPEPGPLVCKQCGKHESEPFDCCDVCVCGGTFQYVQYGWLCSVEGDRFEPMDYGEMHIPGIKETMETSLLRRGARMAAFDSKADAEEALRRSADAMKRDGGTAFQRATFCLVRIITRDKR
jgi:hypothetical protein